MIDIGSHFNFVKKSSYKGGVPRHPWHHPWIRLWLHHQILAPLQESSNVEKKTLRKQKTKYKSVKFEKHIICRAARTENRHQHPKPKLVLYSVLGTDFGFAQHCWLRFSLFHIVTENRHSYRYQHSLSVLFISATDHLRKVTCCDPKQRWHEWTLL